MFSNELAHGPRTAPRDGKTIGPISTDRGRERTPTEAPAMEIEGGEPDYMTETPTTIRQGEAHSRQTLN